MFDLKTLSPNASIYFVGIKGTGMCALAELMHRAGFRITGSDGPDVYYTDAILRSLGLSYFECFDASHINAGIDLVIYSAAYSADTNCELARAAALGLPIVKYTDALGAYSAGFDSAGIAGVHGKTTTTAITGTLFRAAALPAQVLAGSAVSNFGGRSTLSMGGAYFAAETCEYRKHFLSFHPNRIVLTSVESDHQDFFPTYESIRDAFIEYINLLPPNGSLIYCADDPGASEVAASAAVRENFGGHQIKFIPYGFSAGGPFRLTSFMVKNERSVFTLEGFPGELRLRVPGRHTALDAAAALALTDELVRDEALRRGGKGWTTERREAVREALESFAGSKRRAEILGEGNGVLFMDDYAHHPTAIRKTLEGLKEFYPSRRIIVSFMSHTYTRTAALLEEFAASFASADIVFLHKIYASAREHYQGGVNGRTLFEKVSALWGNVYYEEESLDTVKPLKNLLKSGDLFITMGAGDNWKLGEVLLKEYR